MKLKSLLVLFLLLLLSLPQTLVAKDKETPFTLNGKLVPPVVAKVNGVALTAEVLQRELFAFRFQSKQMGKEIEPAEEYSIARELLQSVVARELIVQKAASLGITITDEKVKLQLKNIEDQFPSHKMFITALAFQHMNIASLKDKIRRTLLEDEVMRREIAPKVKVSDEAILKYYEDNRTRFTKPVLYRVSHIHIATISPAGKAEDKASQEKAERLTKMINAEAEEKINSLLKKVQAGGDFADLAKRFSEDDATKEAGGFLGELHPGSTLPEISEAMVKLKEEETSGVIQSKFGYHILKLDEIIPSKLIPFSATKTDIMNLLLKIETKKLFTIYVEELGNSADIKVFL
ncbi:MAG: peptidylprolyl isomerase [Nitrospinae bacterium]|nr:peptidylprolyl isomerase [Nitrospinota bacterium]